MLTIIAAESVTPTTQAITFAVIGAFVTLLTIVLGNRYKSQTAKQLSDQHNVDVQQRLAEKAADQVTAIAKEARDYARQDMVQDRTDRAARRTLRKLSAVERLGKVTHSLVNSDKTASMREKLDSKETELMLIKELLELKRANGIEPSVETLLLLDTKQKQIESLGKDIDERVAEQAAIEVANANADAAAAAADAADDELEDGDEVEDLINGNISEAPPPPP